MTLSRLMSLALGLLIFQSALAKQDRNFAPRIDVLVHNVVHYEPGKMSAWPANLGAQQWVWGNEILISYMRLGYVEQPGHNHNGQGGTQFARSLDGGLTWKSFRARTVPARGKNKMNLQHPDFALKISNSKPEYLYSYDRGATWVGPNQINNLFDHPAIHADEITSRTDYLVTGQNSLLVFLSAKPNNAFFKEDFTYVAKTQNGGESFEYVARFEPNSIYRNVMPSTVRTQDGHLVSCVRRKKNDKKTYWIECYRSTDEGRNWSSLGQVDNTGEQNGNPPALVQLKNGDLACVYGVRRKNGDAPSMSVKVSRDGGKKWSTEFRIRQDFIGPDAYGDVDLGYPRAFVREDGNVVAVYYWATAERPEQHIEASIFSISHD